MCLIVKNKKKLIAKRDITCYKIFNALCGMPLHSMYMFTQFYPNVLYTDYHRISPVKKCFNQENYRITEGVFHSFKTKAAAKAHLSYFTDSTNSIASNYVIYKCRIPKGSIYYEGKTDSFNRKKYYKSYGSKQIELLNAV